VSCRRDSLFVDCIGVVGHEKGAFNGATQRRLGRFELAEEGTLFLMKSVSCPGNSNCAVACSAGAGVERVGGNQPIRANVRVVAATNRDLEAAIRCGAFRSDLFTASMFFD